MLDDGGTGPLRVLIAEDETIIRMDLRGLLEKNGMMVVAEAANGAQAVELARSETPDVAILDLRMPVLDGVEAARRIYAERPRCRSSCSPRSPTGRTSSTHSPRASSRTSSNRFARRTSYRRYARLSYGTQSCFALSGAWVRLR